jgi:hypothetical protein
VSRKLREINKTRRPDGTLTSETAYRLMKRRGGLARAAQLRANGFRDLAIMREKSILVRTLKAGQRRSCKQCKAFAEKVLALLAAERKTNQPIDIEDLRRLG